MKREEFISQALEINAVQANLVSMMISEIPNDKLKDFFAFRMNFMQPMMSKELITKTALFEFNKNGIEARLRNGEQVFKTIYEVKDYLLTFYKGKEIVNGAGKFYDYVIIAMNNDGEMINKFAQNEHGNYKKLDNDDTGSVLEWCLINQHRIGEVKYVRYEEPVQVMIEHKKESKAISNDISKLMNINKIKDIKSM